MNISKYLGDAKYVKARDLGGEDVTVTVADVQLQDIEGDDGEIKRKVVVYFGEDVKPLVLNVTNGDKLIEIFGSAETKNWIGKSCVLYPTTCTFGRDTNRACIRIKETS